MTNTINSGTLKTAQVKTVFELKLLGNKDLLLCCLILALIQLCIIKLNFLNDFFDIEPITAREVVYLILYSSLVLVLMDLSKVLLRLCNYIRRCLAKSKAFKWTKSRGIDEKIQGLP